MNSKHIFKDLSKYCFYLFVFLLPLQIDLSIYAPELYVTGKFTVYQHFLVYISEIFFLFSLIFLGISYIRKEIETKFTYGSKIIFISLLVFFIATEVSLVFAVDQIHSLLWIFRLFIFGLVYVYIVNKFVKVSRIIDIFIAAVSIQAVIAILQYLIQGSVGLPFIGEPALSTIAPGIAKIDLLGFKILRPYGTFAHPNVLAGFLLTSIFFSFHRMRKGNYIAYPLIIVQLIAFVVTFSRSAFLGLLVAFLLYISLHETKISLKYIFLVLSGLILVVVVFNLEQILIHKLLFIDFASIEERLEYLRIGKKMLIEHPFGVGFGNFTNIMQNYSINKLAPWMYQPVHNIFVLTANELGIIGGISFILLIVNTYIALFVKIFNKKVKKAVKEYHAVMFSILTGLVVIGLFDHYLISMFQGFALLFSIISLSAIPEFQNE